MTLFPYNSLFDNVDAHVETHMDPDGARTDAPTTDRTLRELRALVHGPLRHEEEARRVWEDVMREAATDPDSGGSSVLLLIWFAVPRLRRAVRRISWRLPANRFDLEAESVLGLLEAVRVVDPLVAGAAEKLMRAAARRAWQFARGPLPERPVPDLEALPQLPALPSRGGFEPSYIVHITPPDRAEGLAAPIRFSASKERIEGERLGALAEGLGLRDVVHRARRPLPGRRIGTLTLHPTGARNEL
ncbi:hypothetical protein AB0D00_15095 [Streptomyces sp. NPDC048213]|uniref:hypothetical protein n=1 Tax=Streptomyces sp. NPDC048213 TaxID=3160984 RepID=UPI0033FA2665